MGSVRLFLSFVVAIDHMRQVVLNPVNVALPGDYELGVNAGFAVMLFYVISGFLISLGLTKKYPMNLDGTIAFYENRFIRIFSLYWPILLIDILLAPRGREIFLAGSFVDQFTNVFIFGMDWRIEFAAFPNFHWQAAAPSFGQAWTLAVELTFYVAAPYLLRSWRLVWVTLLASALTRLAFVHSFGFDSRWTYMFLPSTFLFFLFGHLAHHATYRWPWVKKTGAGMMFLAVAICMLVIGPYVDWDSLRFWTMVLCFAAALPGLFYATNANRWLNIFGELSYPVYLVHVLVLLYLAPLLLRIIEMLHRGRPAAIAAALVYLAIVAIAAVVAHWLIERPMTNLMRTALSVRNRLKAARAPHSIEVTAPIEARTSPLKESHSDGTFKIV
jgi:peptidoglycan/LPS O-acetylase OafA/YrhL